MITFLYAGACVQTGPVFQSLLTPTPTDNVEPVTNSPPGYFSLNATKSCVNVCLTFKKVLLTWNETCPDNSKAVNENEYFTCKSCDVVNCTTQLLTYSVSQFVNNFHYKFELKFSESVNIQGESQR